MSLTSPLWVSMLVLWPSLVAMGLFGASKRTLTYAIPIVGLVQLGWIGSCLNAISHSKMPIIISVGSWHAPLGIHLNLTGSSMVLALTFTIIMLICQIASLRVFSLDRQVRQFYLISSLLMTAAMVILLANDLFNIYVGLELLGISAISLMLIAPKKGVERAALNYFFAAFSGSLLYLFGVAILYRSYGVLDFELLQLRMMDQPATALAIGLITTGLLVKGAVFPFHFWLPEAHANAPAPVSAILSGIVVKLSLITLIRLLVGPFAGVATGPLNGLLMGLGALAVLYGAILAIRQTHLKQVIAYSTVSQLGYLLMLAGLPLVSGPTQQVLFSGGIYFIITHALAKSGLFLVAGELQHRFHTDKLVALKGLITTTPALLFCYACFALSIIGLPPSGGFIAKWQLLKFSLLSENGLWVLTLIAGGILSALYLYPLIAQGVLTQASLPKPAPERPVMTRLLILLALGSLSMLFLAGPPLEWAKWGSDILIGGAHR